MRGPQVSQKITAERSPRVSNYEHLCGTKLSMRTLSLRSFLKNSAQQDRIF